MARKPKATGDPKSPERKMTPEEQSELFIKTARELGVDETGEEFARAFDRVARSNGKSVKANSRSHRGG